jgi:hypothetical protein
VQKKIIQQSNKIKIPIIIQQLNNRKPLLCKAEKSCLQLTTLNLNHFKMVEDMGLKIIASGPT